jgi:hypothetical protein
VAAQLYIALGIAAASFVAGGGAAWTVQGYRLKACTVERQVLADDLEEQDQAVEALSAQGEETRKKLGEALLATAPAAKAAEAIVARRKAVPVPKSCDAAFDLLDAEK